MGPILATPRAMPSLRRLRAVVGGTPVHFINRRNIARLRMMADALPELLRVIERLELRDSRAHFQKLPRAIAHRNLKRALCFFFGTSLQRKLPNKIVGLAQPLTGFLPV